MLGCAKPQDILLVQQLGGESADHIGRVFYEFSSILSSYKFDCNIMFSDSDPAVIANINQHGKLRLEICGPGDHVNEAETRIKTIKERYRSIISGLTFVLFKQLVIELVCYVVGRLNLNVSPLASDGLCPRVRLTEVLVNAKKVIAKKSSFGKKSS